MNKTTKQLLLAIGLLITVLFIAVFLLKKNEETREWFVYCGPNDNRGFYPLFGLNNDDSKYTYFIQKDGENYFVVMSDIQLAETSEAPFRGSAMKISGSDFPLDEYLNKKVSLTGCFTTETGISTYYLQTVQVK